MVLGFRYEASFASERGLNVPIYLAFLGILDFYVWISFVEVEDRGLLGYGSWGSDAFIIYV